MSDSPYISDPQGTLEAPQALSPGRGSCEIATVLFRVEEEHSWGRQPKGHCPCLNSCFRGPPHC